MRANAGPAPSAGTSRRGCMPAQCIWPADLPAPRARCTHARPRSPSVTQSAMPRRAVRRRGRAPALRLHPPVGQQERRAPHRRRGAAHRRSRSRSTNVPRIRDIETLVELIRVASAPTPSGTSATRCTIHAKTLTPRELDPRALREDPRVDPARRPAARPLRRRSTLPPPGRRRHRPPARSTRTSSRSSSSARRLELGDALRASAPTKLRGADVFLDEPSVTGDRERAHGGGRRRGHDRPPQRRERAARAGSRALPRRAWARSIEGIGTNTLTIHGGAPLARRHAPHRARPHRGRLVHRARRGHALRAPHRATPASSTCARRSWASSASASAAASRATTSIVPAEQSREIQTRPRRPRPEARGPAVAGVPGRRHVDRHRHGDAVRGHDPHAREDVRVAHVLRRQADRHGRAHRALRSAPRHRLRPDAAARRDASSRRTSAPAWRCCSPRSAPTATSTINNVGQIERGYERIDERLSALGARIERVERPPHDVTAWARRRSSGRARTPSTRSPRSAIRAFTTTRDAGQLRHCGPTSRCAR